MSIADKIERVADLKRGEQMDQLGRLFGTLEDGGHEFIITVLDGGVPVKLDGATIAAYFVRPDGATVMIAGDSTGICGNVVRVRLTEQCYALAGRFSIAVRITKDGVTHGVYFANGYVVKSCSDTVAPAGTVLSLEELEERIEALGGEIDDAVEEATSVAEGYAQNAAGSAAAAAASAAHAEHFTPDGYVALVDDVEKLDGLFSLVTPENWYNPDDFTVGKLNKSGEHVDNAELKYTNYYIPVRPGQKVFFYRYKGMTNWYMRTVTAYDASKTAVSEKGRNTDTVTPYTVPEGIYYVRITVDIIENMQSYMPVVYVGDTAPSEYVEYFDPFYMADAGSTYIPYITPEMFGAYGDGTHDDTRALQTAVNYAAKFGKNVLLEQTYGITAQIDVQGVIKGHGTIKWLNPNTRLGYYELTTEEVDGEVQEVYHEHPGYLLYATGNTYLYGITIDCKSNVPYTIYDTLDKVNLDKKTKYNIGLRFEAAGELVVDGCTFRNIYRDYILIGGSTKKTVSITNNYFDATTPTNQFNSKCIGAGGDNANTVISIQNNRFHGYVGEGDTTFNACAIESSNSRFKRLVISGNTMFNMGRLASWTGAKYEGDPEGPKKYTGFSRYCAIDFYFNSGNIIISDNRILDCNWVPIRLHGVQNVKLTGNEFGIAKYMNEPMIWISDSKNSAGDPPVGTRNIIIENNTIAPLTRKHCSTIVQINSLPMHADSEITDVIVRNNTIKNVYAERVFLFDKSVKSLLLENNYVETRYAHQSGQNETIINGVFMSSGNYEGCKFRIVNNDFSVDNGTREVIVEEGATTEIVHENGEIEIVKEPDVTETVTVPGGHCINMSGATGVTAEITGNRLHSQTGACMIGPDNGAGITAIANILTGVEGIRNAAKAIRNISDCTVNYSGIAEAHDNYPAQ